MHSNKHKYQQPNRSKQSGQRQLSDISDAMIEQNFFDKQETSEFGLRKNYKKAIQNQLSSLSQDNQKYKDRSQSPRRKKKRNYKELQEEIQSEEQQQQIVFYHGGKIEKIFATRIRQQSPKKQVQKLCKISASSYLHMQWLTDAEIEQRNIQNLKRRQKITDSLQQSSSNNYFPQSYTKVDKIISASVMFPSLYPKKSLQIQGRWQQILVIILHKLLNFQQYNIPYGATIQFKIDQSADEELQRMNDMEKKQRIAHNNNKLEHLLSRIYFRKIVSWEEFWKYVGKCFQFLYQRHEGASQMYDVQILGQCVIFLYWQAYTYLFSKSGKKNENMENYMPEISFIFKGNEKLLSQSEISQNILANSQNIQQSSFNVPPDFLSQNNKFNYNWLPKELAKKSINQKPTTNNGSKTIIIKFQKIRMKQDLTKLNIFKAVDQLYLVKWQDLSYTQATWQKESQIINSNGQYGSRKIQQFQLFTKLPHKKIRDKLDQYRKYHNSKLSANQLRTSIKNPLLNNTLTDNNQFSSAQDNCPQIYTKQNQPIYKNYKLLKSFQLDGLNWMIKCFKNKHNCILADEMGLGKTIQTIAFLHHLYSYEGFTGPFLIVVPVSTIKQWANQIELWSDFNAVVYKGTKVQREIIEEYLFYYRFINTQGWYVNQPLINKFHILLLNYEMVSSELAIIQKIPFQFIVIDQAHRIKNQNTKLSQSLKKLPCQKILLLTGTPFQNNPNQLWGLLNFIEPKTFNSYQKFKSKHGALKTAEEVQQLQQILYPYLLRRVKSDVEQSIPKLSEILVTLQLTRIQKTYYRGILQQNKNNLLSSLEKVQLNNISMCLRKCCNHPYLLSPSVRKQIESPEEEVYSRENHGNFIETSCKFQFLKKLLIPSPTAQTPKTLIFTQFIDALSILCEFCEMFNISYEYLDGSVPFQERQAKIQNFNYGIREDIRVFIISTKAGGTGINLTSANNVVIFDSDWNPHNDIQAIARAHRIGQKNAVTVYRLIVGNTYEEVIYSTAVKKLGVGMAVLGDWNNKQQGQQKDENEKSQSQDIKPFKIQDAKSKKTRGRKKKSDNKQQGNSSFLDKSKAESQACQKLKGKKKDKDKEEIQKLLRDGVLGFLQNQEKETNTNLENYTIEQIVANSGKIVNYETKDCSFMKTKFSHRPQNDDNKQAELNINDQNFWEIALKNIQSPLQKLLTKFQANESALEYQDSKEQAEFMIQANQIVQTLIKNKIQMKGFNAQDQKEFKDLLFKVTTSRTFHTLFKNIASQWLDEIQKPSRRYEKIQKTDILQALAKIEKKTNQKKKIQLQKLEKEESIKKKEQKKAEFDKKMKEKQQERLQKKVKVQQKQAQKFGGINQKYQKLMEGYCSVCQEKRCSKYCSKLCKRLFHQFCYDKMRKGHEQVYQKPIEATYSDQKILESLKTKFQCFECSIGQVRCFICDKSEEAVLFPKNYRHQKKKDETTEKEKNIQNILLTCPKQDLDKVYQCRSQDCHKFYHLQCLLQTKNQLNYEIEEKQKKNNANFYSLKCSIHYCSRCKKRIQSSGLSCLRCPISYHQKCQQGKNSFSYIQISADKFICKIHLTQEERYLQQLISSDEIYNIQKKDKMKQKKFKKQAEILQGKRGSKNSKAPIIDSQKVLKLKKKPIQQLNRSLQSSVQILY